MRKYIKILIMGILGAVLIFSLATTFVASKSSKDIHFLDFSKAKTAGSVAQEDNGLIDSPIPPGYDTPIPSPRGVGDWSWRGPVPESKQYIYISIPTDNQLIDSPTPILESDSEPFPCPFSNPDWCEAGGAYDPFDTGSGQGLPGMCNDLPMIEGTCSGITGGSGTLPPSKPPCVEGYVCIDGHWEYYVETGMGARGEISPETGFSGAKCVPGVGRDYCKYCYYKVCVPG